MYLRDLNKEKWGIVVDQQNALPENVMQAKKESTIMTT